MIAYPKGGNLSNIKSTMQTIIKHGSANIIDNANETTPVLHKDKSRIFKSKPPINNIPKNSTGVSTVNSSFVNSGSGGSKTARDVKYKDEPGYAKLCTNSIRFDKLFKENNNVNHQSQKNNNDLSRISNNNNSILDISSDVILNKKDISHSLKKYKNFLKNQCMDKLGKVMFQPKNKGIPKSDSGLNKMFEKKNCKNLDNEKDTSISFLQKEKSFITAPSRQELSREPSFKLQKQNSMKKNSKIIDIFQKNHNIRAASKNEGKKILFIVICRC